MNIKHIFFDLDHTLWDFDKNSELCFKQIFKEQGLKLDFDLFLKTYIPINFEYWKLFREEKVTKEALRYGRLKDTFDALSYEVNDDLINIISENYITYLPNHNYLIEGSIDVLEYLVEKYKLHIITNGFKEVQYLKLDRSGIRKYFTSIVTSECVGVKKPNAKVFEYALQKANVVASESVMIGDSYEADVLGAFNVGIKPIYYDAHKTLENKENRFVTINSLLELKQYL